MPPRHDFSKRPSAKEFQNPLQQYPTPNIDDLVIVEDVEIRSIAYAPLSPGTPHPNFPAALLTWQGNVQTDNQQTTVRRIYATTRSSQDAYNYAIKYAAAATTAPTFIRTYIVPRIGYVASPRETPLTSLVGIVLTAGGTGYPETNGTAGPTIAFSGGGGSGAGAVATVQSGSIVALTLVNGGTGYTSAPAVTFGGGGSGATATALLQPATALLVDEEVTDLKSTDPQINSLFVQVVKTFKTLPGPLLTNQKVNERGEVETEFTQELLSSSATLHADGLNVISSSLESSDTVVSTSKYSTVPAHPTLAGWEYEPRRTMGARAIRTVDIIAPGSIDDALPIIDVKGGVVLSIAGVATGSPGVLNVVAHGFIHGDAVFVSGFDPGSGTPAINRQIWKVGTVTDSNHFTLLSKDGTALAITAAPTGSGLICKAAILDAEINQQTVTKSQKAIVYRADDEPVYIPDWEVDPRTDVPILTLKLELNTSAVPTTWSNGATKNISALTTGSPAHLTITAHGFTTGDKIFLSEVVDSVPLLNAKSYTLTVVDSNTVSIPVNLGTAGSGGKATKVGTVGYLAAREALIAASVMTQNDALEFKTYDRWSSIQIVAKIPALVSGNWVRQYSSSMQHRFPDVLQAAAFFYAYAIAGTGYEALDIGFDMQINKGYEGVCVARITDILTYSPGPFDATYNPSGIVLPGLTVWHPQIYEIPAVWAISGATEAVARTTTFRIPPVVHADLSIGYGSEIGSPSGSVVIGGSIFLPATDATLPTSGAFYVDDITTEKWRFGSYLIRVLEIQHP